MISGFKEARGPVHMFEILQEAAQKFGASCVRVNTLNSKCSMLPESIQMVLTWKFDRDEEVTFDLTLKDVIHTHQMAARLREEAIDAAANAVERAGIALSDDVRAFLAEYVLEGER